MRAPIDPNEPNKDDDLSEDELPVFHSDYIAENLSPCKVDNCEHCGLGSEFCTMCDDGFTRSDGKCLTECTQGFFSADGICFKCSPMCQSCSVTANRCDSCHEAGDDFAFNKLITEQSVCASVCPPGTFETESGGMCN